MLGALIFVFKNKESKNSIETFPKREKVLFLKQTLSILHQVSASPIVVLSDNPRLWDQTSIRNDVFFICPDYNEFLSAKHLQKAFHILDIACEQVLVCDIDSPPFSISVLKTLLQKEGNFVIPLLKGKRSFPILANLPKLISVCRYEKEIIPDILLNKLASEGELIPFAGEGQEHLLRATYCDLTQPRTNIYKTDCFYPVSKLMISGDYIFLGPGIYQLLLAIDKYNSLKYASELTGLSYSKCRRIIKRLESESAIKVLKSKKGGSDGGYTALTREGKILLKNYALYTKNCNNAIKKIFERFITDLKEDLDVYGNEKS